MTALSITIRTVVTDLLLMHLIIIYYYYTLLFTKGDLGLLGITVDSQYGGSGMDATAAVIVHG